MPFAKSVSLGCWVKFADKFKVQKLVKFKNKARFYGRNRQIL
ncbi:hypothetical protein CSUNSWCD_730 [Campylobacter showae CSUNSWCD]|uniref:Uncharacterized protein n=1 Tax=Campylobacter showae CSUNSWCD TaxID=1244083 RepID=M5IPK1_9BACT|nr:hypothetical protein CSUNSWCD_730 [Campylobacter showae CSUNSWCD]